MNFVRTSDNSGQEAEHVILYQLKDHTYIDHLKLIRDDGGFTLEVTLHNPPLEGTPEAINAVVEKRGILIKELEKLRLLQRQLETPGGDASQGMIGDMLQAMGDEQMHVLFDAGPTSKIRSVLQQVNFPQELQQIITSDLMNEWRLQVD